MSTPPLSTTGSVTLRATKTSPPSPSISALSFPEPVRLSFPMPPRSTSIPLKVLPPASPPLAGSLPSVTMRSAPSAT